MEELERQTSLQAMGVLPLVASSVLPGAKASTKIPVVQPVVELVRQHSPVEARVVNAAAKPKSTGVGQARQILGVDTDVPTAKKQTHNTPKPAKQRESLAEQADSQFRLLCLCFANKLGFIVALGEEMPEIAAQLCREVASVVSGSHDVAVVSEHIFQWPLQQAGLSRDFSTAQDVFKGVLAAQLATAERLFLMGDTPARLLLQEAGTEFQWTNCNKHRCLLLPGLTQLLAEPMLKKQLLLNILDN